MRTAEDAEKFGREPGYENLQGIRALRGSNWTHYPNYSLLKITH